MIERTGTRGRRSFHQKIIVLKTPSLKTRILIAVILLVIGVALLVSFASFVLMQQRVRQIVAEQQSVLLANAAREVDQKFALRRASLDALVKYLAAGIAAGEKPQATDPSASSTAITTTPAAASSPSSSPSSELLQRLLAQRAGALVLFDRLELATADGRILASLDPGPRTGDLDVVTGPTTSLPMPAKDTTIVLSAPVPGAAGQSGLLLRGAIGLRAAHFIAGLEQMEVGRDGYFSIIATDGTTIMQRAGGATPPATGKARPDAENRALSGFEGTIEDTSRGGVRGLYSFKRIGAAPWILVAFYPEAEAFAALAALQRSAVLAALALVAVAAPLAWLFIRRQFKPLQQLHARILAIRAQPTQALAPQRYADDEMGDLAKNFDDLMRDRLYAEARYQSGAEELRAATNTGLDAFFIFNAERDASGRITDFTIRYLNTIAERMLGKPLDGLAQAPLRTTFAAHPLVSMFDKYLQVMHSGVALQEEVCIDDPEVPPATEAGKRWFLLQIVPQADGVALTARDITARKRDEIEIRSSRAFLQSLTDHLPMLFYAKRIRPDGIGEYVTWNHAAETITGFASADVLGKTDRVLYPARLAAAYEAHDRSILLDPVPLDIPETRFHRRDGSVRYMHVMSVPIFDEAGRVEYIIGIGDDITERRQQERILRNSQAELQAVNDSSPLGLFTTDVAGNCTYVNRTYETMSGFTVQELVGDSWLQSLHPDDQDAAIEGWIEAIRQHQPYQGVLRFRRPDGSVVWGSFKAVPMVIDGQVTAYVGSVDDITARLEVENALSVSEQRLRMVTDNIPALIAYITPDQHFQFGNRKYQRAFGLPQADIGGMPAIEVLGPDVYAQSAPYIEGALRGIAANFERLVTHVGQLRWERVSYVPDVGADNEVNGFFSLVEDITELKQAQHTFAKSEMRLRMITDNLPALIAYIDRDGRYRFCNGYYETIVGIKPEKILGRKVEEIVGRAGYEAVARNMQLVLTGERVTFERHVKSAELDRHFLYDYIPDIGIDGSVVGFYSMVLDITERKTAELKQAASEVLLRTLTDNLPALVGFIDREERFQFNNQVYAEWLDKPLAEITGRSMRDVYGEHNYLLYKPYFEQALKGAKVEFEFEAPRDGKPHFFRAAYAPQIAADGSTSGVCSMINDITALKTVENQLRILARFDSLTGLPNRNQFEEKLIEAIARSVRSKRAMAVMFLDIDHFKDINDTIGHHGGDAVLREFATRLQRCVRKTDTVSRLAGDEFTIILEGLQVDDETAVVASKIIGAMQEQFHIGDAARSVTTSIGIAVRRSDETNAEALLRRADEALYVAKSAGRNTFESVS